MANQYKGWNSQQNAQQAGCLLLLGVIALVFGLGLTIGPGAAFIGLGILAMVGGFVLVAAD